MSTPQQFPVQHAQGTHAALAIATSGVNGGVSDVSSPCRGKTEDEEKSYPEEDPEYRCPINNRLWIYRDRTMALLRRYCRFAVEVGRLPSLLGREFFRTRITSYRTSTFEDTVIFVHDVERCLEELDPVEKELIARIVLQDYTQEEAASLIGCGYRTVARRFPETLDRVSELFLERHLLIPLPEVPSDGGESCQEAVNGKFSASDLKQGE